MQPDEVRKIYYSILVLYVAWTFFGAFLFQTYGQPKMMVLVVANFNNLGLGFTPFFVSATTSSPCPPALRPGWVARLGIGFCGVFYLGSPAWSSTRSSCHCSGTAERQG
ncbi:MAG: hypothetical protein Ct9H300mP1_27970 [Planctomycetaceae bacterium]|nr:MAG: hypothetical protein Ct9H300mP1_27970 [Planctomycetaceae bacterium]